MSWARIDDRFSFHPKVIAAGNAATGAYVRALAYCAGHGTDGFVANAVAEALGSRKELERVCSVELWEKVAAGEVRTVTGRIDGIGQGLRDVEVVMPDDGYFIADFLHFNPTKIESEELRERRREAGRAGGQRTAASAVRDSSGRFTSQASAQASAWMDAQAGAWSESKQVLDDGLAQHPSFPVPSRSSTPAAPQDDRRDDAHTRANGRAGGEDFTLVGETVEAQLERVRGAAAQSGAVS